MRTKRLDEMVEVFAIDSTSESPRFRPGQWLPDPRDILIICSSLVSVATARTEDASTQASEADESRMAHFSIKNYLISERLRNASMHCYHITKSFADVSIAVYRIFFISNLPPS